MMPCPECVAKTFSNPRYAPHDLKGALGYLTEECGEVLAAIGKTQRWGPLSYNPELPISERESNKAWLLRELHDLERAISLVRAFLAEPEELVREFP